MVRMGKAVCHICNCCGALQQVIDGKAIPYIDKPSKLPTRVDRGRVTKQKIKEIRV